MSYAIVVQQTDIVGALVGNSVTAGIYVPPPASGTSGSPLAVATATSTIPTFTLTFPSAFNLPSDVSGVLVSDTTTPGDLFRSGPMQPVLPSTLNLTVAPPAVVQAAQLRLPLPITYNIPDSVRALVGLVTVGSVIPWSITATDATLALGPTSLLTVTGSVDLRFGGLLDQSSGFSLTTPLVFRPSADISDTARIMSVSYSGLGAASVDLTIDALLAFPPALLAIGQFAAGAIASQVESQVNQQIATQVANTVAQLQMQLTSTAVISLGRLIITSSGISLTLVVGDLLGPGIEPISIPKHMSVGVTPQWNCGVSENYVVKVFDFAHNSPVAGAQVSLTNADGKHNGVTDANGSVELPNVVLKSWITEHPTKNVPVIIQNQPVLKVSASGFNDVTAPLSCPL